MLISAPLGVPCLQCPPDFLKSHGAGEQGQVYHEISI